MKSVKFGHDDIVPSKVVCVGRNYVEHISELGNEISDEMVIFIKPNAAIGTDLCAYHQEQLHYEAELCFLYQQGSFSAVAVGLDLTKRSLQSKLKAKGLPWERAKTFSGSALFSDFVAIESINKALTVTLDINNQRKQTGSVAMMLYSPEVILKEIMSFIELEDGDIVMTGTPAGVGKIVAGDVFQGQVIIDDIMLISKTWQAK